MEQEREESGSGRGLEAGQSLISSRFFLSSPGPGLWRRRDERKKRANKTLIFCSRSGFLIFYEIKSKESSKVSARAAA